MFAIFSVWAVDRWFKQYVPPPPPSPQDIIDQANRTEGLRQCADCNFMQTHGYSEAQMVEAERLWNIDRDAATDMSDFWFSFPVAITTYSKAVWKKYFPPVEPEP